MINYFNTQREQIANNSLKADYLKSEFQTRLDMLNINFKDQMKNMIERTEYSINELNTGYGSVVKIVMDDSECVFTLNDYAEVENELRVPMVNQFACEKLFKSEFTTVNYNNGKCMLFK